MTTAVAKKKTATSKKVGRTSPLENPQIHEELINMIHIGVPVRHACQAVGINEKTFYNWLSRGMTERDRLNTIENAKPNPTEVVFYEFLQAVERARAEAVAKKVAVITKSSASDWRAAAWWLERQSPAEFGKTERIEHTGANGEEIKVTVTMGELQEKIARVIEMRKVDE